VEAGGAKRINYMRAFDYVYGLMADILSSLGTASIVIVIAFVIALIAGLIDLGTVLEFLGDLAP